MKPSSKKITNSAAFYESQLLKLMITHYLDDIKKQVHHVPETSMPIVLNLDMNFLLDREPGFGNWVVANLPKFLRLAPRSLFQTIVKIFEGYGRLTPSFINEEYIEFIPVFLNFPFYKFDFHDSAIKKQLINSKNGRLLSLDNASVVKTYQTDYYLWRQTYLYNCSCNGTSSSDVTHLLVEYLKRSFKNVKETAKPPVCSFCRTPCNELAKKRVFLPCQKVDIHLQGQDPHYSEQKIYSLWVTNDNVGKLERGDIISGVVYYDIFVNYAVIANKMLGTPVGYMVGFQLSKTSANLNQEYFSNLFAKLWKDQGAPLYQYVNFEEPDFEYLLNGWNSLKNCLRAFHFGVANSFVLLNVKLSLLFSIVLGNITSLRPFVDFQSVRKLPPNMPKVKRNPIFDERISVFMIADEVDFLMRIINELTSGLDNFFVFPSVYDQNTLNQFLLQLRDGILLIINPHRLGKSEVEIVNKLVKGDKIYLGDDFGYLELRCSVWVIATEPLAPKKTNKGWQIRCISDFWSSNEEYFDIVLDVSRMNNLIKGVHLQIDLDFANYLILDQSVQGYIDLDEDEYPSNDQNMRKVYSTCKEYKISNQESLDKIKASNNKNAILLFQRYYTASRKQKQMSMLDLNSLRKISNASSLLRNIYSGMILAMDARKDISLDLDMVDIIIAILLNEESCINRRGIDDVILGSSISKFFYECYSDDSCCDRRDLPESNDRSFLSLCQRIMSFISGTEQRTEGWEC